MKSIRFILLAASLSFLFGCGNEANPDQIKFPSSRMVSDAYHGEQILVHGPEDIAISGGGYADPFVVNGKEVPTPGYVMSVYTADFNEDGYPELCLECSTGSGFINESIFIYDYHNRNPLFTLSDRKSHDYRLGFLDDEGFLYAYEYPVLKKEMMLRYGRIGYRRSGEIVVEWKQNQESGTTESESI